MPDRHDVPLWINRHAPPARSCIRGSEVRHFESIRYSFVARVSKIVYHIVTEGGVLTPVGLITD